MTRRFLTPALLVIAFAAHAADAPGDPLRYLEDMDDARSQSWIKDESERARAALDAIPGRAKMLARIRELSDSTAVVSRLTLAGKRLFYLKLASPHAQPVLCMREGLDGAEHEVLDPANFLKGEGRGAIDWFVPSPDGRYVAVGGSARGTGESVLRVLDVEAGRPLPFEIDRARFNENLAWHPDGHSFYYSRIPEGQSGAKRYANIRVYRHVIGRETSHDEVVFGAGVGGARDVPEFSHPSLHVPLEGRYAYAIVRDGERREFAVHVTDLTALASGKPRWRKIVGVEDEVTDIEGWRGDLFLLTHRNAPRHRVLRMKANDSLAQAKQVVPQGDSVIDSMTLAHDALYLRTMVGGIDRLERVPIGLLGTKAPEFLRTPFDNAITQIVADARLPGAMLLIQGWIDPPRVVQVEPKYGEIRETRVIAKSRADFGQMDVVRLYATAADNVKIPVTLFYRKGTQLDRRNPTLVSAYGSHGATYSPDFDARRLAWLERGGVIAIAHVRGGGEFGEGWHEAGRGRNKATTITDFITCIDFLESYGFTSPERMAIEGRGAGGIAVGGALVRRPDLFTAAVARVPLTDMLRYEAMPMGPFSVPEFGSAATPEGVEQLRAISAYENVKDGTPYPAVLLTAGLNDARVSPWQAAKMAARLQQATTSGKPVLLRMDMEGGHGSGTPRDRSDEELADIYSFLLWQMGDPEFQPKPAPVPVRPADEKAVPSAK